MNSHFNLEPSDGNKNRKIIILKFIDGSKRRIVQNLENLENFQIDPLPLADSIDVKPCQNLKLSDQLKSLSKPFSCPHCDNYRRNSRFKIMKHIKKKHFQRYEFQCCSCKQSYDSEKYLRLHIKISHPEVLKAVLMELRNIEEKMDAIMKTEIPDDDLKPKLEVKNDVVEDLQKALEEEIDNIGFPMETETKYHHQGIDYILDHHIVDKIEMHQSFEVLKNKL